MERIRIATRRSPLALAQTEIFIASFRRAHPDISVETLPLMTTGDKLLDAPLATIGGKGVFTKELDQALLSNRADLAVHSLKDIPHTLPDGLSILAYLPREDPRDVLIAKKARSIQDLPIGASIGTSSLRRQTQLLHLRQDLRIVPVRGNVGTRLKRFSELNLDGLILARAGIERLGLNPEYEPIPKETIIPALGQGIIAIIGRSKDEELALALQGVGDFRATIEAGCERCFVRLLGGGCQIPVAGNAHLEGDRLYFQAAVGSVDGRVLIKARSQGRAKSPEALAKEVFDNLKNQGLLSILRDILG